MPAPPYRRPLPPFVHQNLARQAVKPEDRTADRRVVTNEIVEVPLIQPKTIAAAWTKGSQGGLMDRAPAKSC